MLVALHLRSSFWTGYIVKSANRSLFSGLTPCANLTLLCLQATLSLGGPEQSKASCLYFKFCQIVNSSFRVFIKVVCTCISQLNTSAARLTGLQVSVSILANYLQINLKRVVFFDFQIPMMRKMKGKFEHVCNLVAVCRCTHAHTRKMQRTPSQCARSFDEAKSEGLMTGV